MRQAPRIMMTISLACFSCTQSEEPIQSGNPGRIASDQALYALITGMDPYTSYTLFPGADSVTAGTLNGSIAHRPMVRVSMNIAAAGALRTGRLPSGGAFPDSSVIVKEIRSDGQTTLLAVVYKESGNPLSNGGWLWAEFKTDGSPFYSVQSRGSACIGCHELEKGLQNDRIRTFERQHP